MTNEMKLLTALCEALGFEVEEERDSRRIAVNMPVIDFSAISKLTMAGMALDTIDGKYVIDDDGLYSASLITDEITYKLIPKHSKGGE